MKVEAPPPPHRASVLSRRDERTVNLEWKAAWKVASFGCKEMCGVVGVLRGSCAQSFDRGGLTCSDVAMRMQ